MGGTVMLGRSFIGLTLAAGLVLAAGDTRLADAARQGDRNAVQTLLRQKADVNAGEGDGTKALHWAASTNDIEMAKTLLAAGANVKAKSRIGGVTPLFMACRNGSAAMIELLLKAGADASAPDAVGTTPLMLAAASGSAEAVQVLIDHGANVSARESAHKQTALMFAAALDRGAAIKVLMAHGANAEATTVVSKLGCGSLFNRSGCLELDEDGSPVLEEVKPGEKDVPRCDGPCPEPKLDDIAITPKESAAVTGAAPAAGAKTAAGNKAAAAKPVFEGKLGATLMGGQTALLFAARDGQLEAARALLESGANVNNAGTGDKMSPLLMAISNGHFDVAKFLLDHGADPNQTDNNLGLSPLFETVDMQWAPYAWFPQPVTANERVTYLDLMKALLDHGADPNTRLGKRIWFRTATRSVEMAGSTAFLRAAMASDYDAMRLLVANGADPNLPTASRATPLMVAAGLGWAANYSRNAPDWMPAVRFALDLGGQVNAVDSKGYAALHGAAFRGDNEMVNFLVDAGARVELVAKDGNTVADMANGPLAHSELHPTTVALLEKLGSKNSHNCRSALCVVIQDDKEKNKSATPAPAAPGAQPAPH